MSDGSSDVMSVEAVVEADALRELLDSVIGGSIKYTRSGGSSQRQVPRIFSKCPKPQRIHNLFMLNALHKGVNARVGGCAQLRGDCLYI